MAFIIGIGGVSRSGKSTLAQRLKEALAPNHVLSLDLDEYVFDEKEIPHIKGHPDWEVPESIDYARVLRAIAENKSEYDVIIVEGILAFANSSLNDQYDLTVFMEISKDTYFERRRLETRWGKDPEWYLKHVWETHLKYGQYREADFVLSGETEISEADLQQVIQKIDSAIR